MVDVVKWVSHSIKIHVTKMSEDVDACVQAWGGAPTLNLCIHVRKPLFNGGYLPSFIEYFLTYK